MGCNFLDHFGKLKEVRAYLVRSNRKERKGKDSKKVQFYCLVEKPKSDYLSNGKANSPK